MPRELKRSMTLLHATSMVIGTIIGASIFVQPSEIIGRVQSIRDVVLVWTASGALTMCGALVCAELASAFPRTGGVYIFLKETFSPALGFLWGWAMFWSMHSGIIAAIAVIFARYATFLFPSGMMRPKALAISAIWFLSAINYVGVRAGSRLQTTLTAAKVFAIFLLIVFGFVLGSRVPAHFVSSTTLGTPGLTADYSPLGEFLPALVAGLFAFGGWHMVTYTAGETREPTTTIPLALVLGTMVVTICYVGLNVTYLYVLPLDQVASSSHVAADAAEALVGRSGAVAVAALVVVSGFGALSGIILAGPRVYFSMARDGLLFRWFGEPHPSFQTPHRAIALQAVWASILVLTGTYRELFTRVIYTEWIFFGLMAAGLFFLRRRANYTPRFRTWGYPVVPALFVFSSLLIVLNQIAADPTDSAIGLGMVGLGLPVYHFWARAGRRL